MAYFLVSVSNKTNLDLCIKYAMAGFTNSINGAWTFVEINEGDYISFLYGARAYNLYQVEKKVAFKDAQELPPWPAVTFSMSGNTYYFPFRLFLKPIRELKEPLVRAEFAYVAENLLLRGGYRRTHFQADQTTLQAVSQMGELSSKNYLRFEYGAYKSFELMFTKNKGLIRIPEIFGFQEYILQSIIRQFLSKSDSLQKLLNSLGMGITSSRLEILGEKAIPEGHIDILIKESIPIGQSRKIIIEVKTGAASLEDIAQTRGYVDELGSECIKGILIASKFSNSVIKYAREKNLALVAYNISSNFDGLVNFAQILNDFQLSVVV